MLFMSFSVYLYILYMNVWHVNCIHVMSLKEESGRFLVHFREIFEICIEYRNIPDLFQGDFEFLLKSGTFRKNFCKFYSSFPGVSLMMMEVSHICNCCVIRPQIICRGKDFLSIRLSVAFKF